MSLGVDRGDRVVGIVEPVGGRGRRHELRDPLRTGRRSRVRVEVRFSEELGGEQRSGDVPARRRAEERLSVGARDERRQPLIAPALAVGLGQSPVLADPLPRRRARRRPGGEPVMPRLPAVALREAEARGVRRQPAVGGGGTEVELGPAAVQRCAGRRDPTRVGMLVPEGLLLGVGAERRVDDQGDAVSGRGRGHPVERRGHVGAHRLALAVGQRPRVAAAARHRRLGGRSARGRRWGHLGLGGDLGCRILVRIAPRVRLDRGSDLHPHLKRPHRPAVREPDRGPDRNRLCSPPPHPGRPPRRASCTGSARDARG